MFLKTEQWERKRGELGKPTSDSWIVQSTHYFYTLVQTLWVRIALVWNARTVPVIIITKRPNNHVYEQCCLSLICVQTIYLWKMYIRIYSRKKSDTYYNSALEGLHHSGHRSPRTSWRGLRRKRPCWLPCFRTSLTWMNYCCKFFKCWNRETQSLAEKVCHLRSLVCAHEWGTLTNSYINYIMKCSCHNLSIKIDFFFSPSTKSIHRVLYLHVCPLAGCSHCFSRPLTHVWME